MSNGLIDPMVGRVFGRLTVKERLPKTNHKSHDVKYKVECECGNIKNVWKGSLVSGLTRSCGCLMREVSAENGRKTRSDLVGKRFGRLVVLEFAGNNNSKHRRVIWKCICDCGNISYVETANLTGGHTTSCGCYGLEALSKSSVTHGMANTRLYRIWCDMRQRCKDKNSSTYQRYGAVGISVCKEWDESFNCFYEWAKDGYKDGLTIDRIDTRGNYEPSNCRWATYTEQTRNRKSTLSFTINGETKPIAEWCDVFGVDYNLVNCRRQRGWDIRDLFNKIGEKRKYPINKNNKACFVLNA